MKKILVLILGIQFAYGFSQKNIKVYQERKGDTLVYYADNQEVYPMSFVFSGTPELENAKAPEAFKKVQIIPAQSLKNQIAYFVVLDKKKKWGARKMPGYTMYIGDVSQTSYDADYQYDLPFKKGNTFTVHQGYNGAFSHRNENSLDFKMPEGTEITAAREGIVTDFVKHHNTGCPSKSCVEQGNYVTIMHSDGTFAQYYHLKENGVKVNLGDQVKKGDVIALSGNTGWSNGPHLHFACYIPNLAEEKLMKTVKTLFRTGNGDKAEYLAEKKKYSRQY
ncbi:MAG: M23 family metallopeptidase [Chryseobacterium sp.]|uniref:M23 family metallopeptidase n=1 Tax=Chryseobacterium sp. TaxID=1871047 RepID=UPI0028388C71|nr:M23 family metallopeptidase [Chryseobacterium sp.]MDR2236155.1 M23 family metallopeptidase [Chryseobacterium sp.]